MKTALQKVHGQHVISNTNAKTTSPTVKQEPVFEVSEDTVLYNNHLANN